MEIITIHERPQLRRPVLIAGFSGWPDAGSVSTETLSYLREKLGVKKFADLDPDSFCHFTSNRPLSVIEGGMVRSLRMPTQEFFYWKGDRSHDLILFLGKEPDLRWKQYVEVFLALVADLAVEMLITIGGSYDYISHHHEPPVSGVFNDENLKRDLARSGIQFSQYQGPISIHTMLLMEAGKIGLKGLGIWGHAPHYVQSKNLWLLHEILLRLCRLTGLELDLTELKTEADVLCKQIDMVVQENPELSQLIEQLDRGPVPRADLPPDDKVISIDEFLKKDPSHHKYH